MYVESRYFCLSLSQKFPKIDLSNNDIFHSICFFRLGFHSFDIAKIFVNDVMIELVQYRIELVRFFLVGFRLTFFIAETFIERRQRTPTSLSSVFPHSRNFQGTILFILTSDNKLTPSFFSFFFRYRKTFKYETRDLSRIRRGLRNLLTRGMGRKQQGRTF